MELVEGRAPYADLNPIKVRPTCELFVKVLEDTRPS
jgi:hypothetical protein